MVLMTEETNTLLDDFDLRDMLIGRDMPEDAVTLYMNEALAFEMGKISKKLQYLSARAATGDEKAAAEFTALDDVLAEKRDKLSKQGLVFHLRGITKRQKEDIQSSGLHEFPLKRDMFGRDDSINELERVRFLRIKFFTAFVDRIVTPAGKTQIIANNGNPSDAAISTMKAFAETAPEPTIEALDEAIGELSGKIDFKTLVAQESDFLS